MNNAYSRAGVDVDIEAEASRIMYEAAKRTYANRTGRIGEIVVPFDDFAGLKMIRVEMLPTGSCMSLGFDGVGAKVEIAQRIKRYDTIAYDLFAMICDDAVLRGAEPAVVGSVLDIKSLGTDERYIPIIKELALGYVMAADAANVAVINGEIAQMGAIISGYGDFPFSWSGACVWFGRDERLLSGSEISAGDSIVLLGETGFRANGLSLVRKIFAAEYGAEWHEQDFLGRSLGEAVLTPSTIYARLIVELNGGFDGEPLCPIHGIFHITGGGIPEKLGRVLRKSGLGAHIRNPFTPPFIMRHCQEVGQVTDYDAYKTWNMGQGMGVITPDPETVIARATSRGICARNSGEVVDSGMIAILSRGRQNPEEWLVY